MGKFRFTISGIMGLVVAAAIGFAALRDGSEAWASITFAATAIILLMAVSLVIYSRGATRAAWLGFTLFGWAYFVFIFGWWSGEQLGVPPLPTKWLLGLVHDQIHAKPQYIPNPQYTGVGFASLPGMNMPQLAPPYILKPGTTYWTGNELNYRQIGHCLIALVFGALGAVWSRIAFAFHARRDPRSCETRTPPSRSVSEDSAGDGAGTLRRHRLGESLH
jgi:hypothetical protein